jgi:hypothetical protein
MLDTNKSGTGTTQPLVLKFAGVEVSRLTSTGLAVTGALSATGDVFINRAAGTDRIIWFQSGGLKRWAVYATSTAESGSNTGTNLAFDRIADDGTTTLSNALVLNRETGNATFSGAVAIGNTVNTVNPTSPNRTITMVIGGTTYYLHAKTTNN